ncbi:hypothetical protein [Oceanicola sp. 22II-s10i]|uniref:hypothetical protein n=1 Tax=Oceanicola sp. 22II-s10i TaxID=1317116 RepID=UPI0011318A76|nr:hypothetical protein [Oceanicola sp. 22II-s10i]
MKFRHITYVMSAIAVFQIAAPVHAGSDNTLVILQESTAGAFGNTLTVDQSQAFGSTIAGNEQGTAPAVQSGFGNNATVTLEGEGANVVLLQSNPAIDGTAADVNSANLSGGALTSILVNQNGIGNFGDVDVFGVGASGTLVQNGNGNWGSVDVLGNGVSGSLNQNGNDNELGIQVSGSAGTSVTYIQNGNGLTAATLPQVYSNGGTVTITQTTN